MSDVQHPNNTPDANESKPIADSQRQPYQQSKPPLWILPALAVILIIGVFIGRYWGSDTTTTAESVASTNTTDIAVKTDSSVQAVLTVETVQPSQEDIANTLSADGTISAQDIANVSAKVNGVAIERIMVEAGQRVTAGQVLAVFDTDAMQQQVLQAEASVAEAQATLANATANATRVLPLIDIDAISRQEADRYRTAELQARAALQAAQSRLSSQRLTLNNATVVAPVSGIISEKIAEVGMVAGDEALFTIIKGGILEWQADIDPKLIGEVSVGTAVTVRLPNDQSVTGVVRRIAPTADNNRQITIYASLEPNSAARVGMYQTGEFLLGRNSTQTIPNSTIVSNDGYDYVMLVTNISTQADSRRGQIKRMRVTLGERVGNAVAVIEPLPANSQLVKQGGSFLNEGDMVRIVDSTTNSATNSTTNSATNSTTNSAMSRTTATQPKDKS